MLNGWGHFLLCYSSEGRTFTAMTRKVVLRGSPIHGIGVFAGVDFPKGAILRIDDSHVVSDKAPMRASHSEYDYYCTYLVGGKVVLMQPLARHINHSYDPNAFVRTRSGDRYVVRTPVYHSRRRNHLRLLH